MDWIRIGALWGFLAVSAGAFGAHGLEGRVDLEELAWWETAVQYHLVHALALVAFGILRRVVPGGQAAGWCFLFGDAVFSGTLYAMALGGPPWLGAVTPVGGVAMLAGWLVLALPARGASQS